MMNHATRQAAMVPDTASIFCSKSSLVVVPFSTTLLCVKNIIHGAIVVPIIAMTSDIQLTPPGTTVEVRASFQSGWASTAAMI